jgi:hypothetical protein
MRRHGESTYLVRGWDQLLERDQFMLYLTRKLPVPVSADEFRALQVASNSASYVHIFGEHDLKAELPDAALTALADAMNAQPGTPALSADVPAGYTYLGQFIIHDISFLSPSKTGNDWIDKRTAALDLDSVLPFSTPAQSLLAGPGQGPLAVGFTSGDNQLAEDLPRDQQAAYAGRPLIEDPRNDDFLPLSQCHLALIKFYNAIARLNGYLGVPGQTWPDSWWADVRRTWMQHFQAVVLHDYLPRLVDTTTYADVLAHGRKLVRAGTHANDIDWMPLEFAGAIGRFGHSMIRDSYMPWNCSTPGLAASVQEFMHFSYSNSGDALASESHRLPMNWITDWRRLFDFTGTSLGPLAGYPMLAAAIDSRLTSALSALPTCLRDDMCYGDPQSGPAFDLATATMIRGIELNLASGQQAVIAANGPLGNTLPMLSLPQIIGGDAGIAAAFEDCKALNETTPLWFYMLREAEVLGAGRLGPLAGRVLMETLHAAIEAAPDNIISNKAWQPSLPRASAPYFTMMDLLLIAGHPDPLGALAICS